MIRFSQGVLTLAGLAALGLTTAQPAQAQTTITTVPQSTGSNYIAQWGVTNTSTYGQTFTAPTDNVLNNFSFYLGGRYDGSGPIKYQAYVYAWDGTKAAGSALFTGAVQSYTPTGAINASNLVFTDTGNTTLASGQKYVAFLSTAGLQTGQPASTSYWNLTDSSNGAYSGGDYVFFNTGNDFNALTTSKWDDPGFGIDAKFTMNFSPNSPAPAAVPEPSQSLAFACGVLGLMGMVAVRRRKAAVPV